MSEKSELWWVSVGGEDCEPARIVIRDKGQPEQCFTVGCNDGTDLVEGCGIEKVVQMSQVPHTPAKAAALRAEWEKKREADAKRGIHHSYRRWPAAPKGETK